MGMPRAVRVGLTFLWGLGMLFTIHEIVVKNPAPKDVAYSYAQDQGYSALCFEAPTKGTGNTERIAINFKMADETQGAAILSVQPDGSSWIFAQNWVLDGVEAGSHTLCTRWIKVSQPAVRL